MTIKKNLSNWYVSKHPDTIKAEAFQAPEIRNGVNPSLVGILDSGKAIITSAIREVQGRIITTRSGSIYVLTGEPDPHFHEFLSFAKLQYCEAEPLNPLIPGYIREIKIEPNGDGCWELPLHINIEPMFACCQCRTANSLARQACKVCQHPRCGLVKNRKEMN